MRFSSLLAFAFAAVVSTAPVNSPPAVTYKSCNRPGVFALTFDDGPYQYSWDLAEYLHANGIKATFFINGYNWVTEPLDRALTPTASNGTKTYYEVLKHYYDLGHEIGSHTYRHTPLPGLTAEQVFDEMNQLSDVVYKAVGVRPALMRPPRGELDTGSAQILGNLGYSVIDWDLDTKDWEGNSLSHEQAVVYGVVEADIPDVTPGHICLQHDVHQESVEELTPWLINYISQKNYTFVTVSDCLGINPYQ